MSGDDKLPISLVAHTVFCPRRAWLEAQGEQADSYAMTAGTLAHRRVDQPAESRPEVRRAVSVHSESLGITGRCDVVEVSSDGLSVVEYKSTPVRRKAEITPAQAVQVGLQSMCLEEMGHHVTSGVVHFVNHHKDVPVPLGAEAREACRDWVTETRKVVEADSAPPPLLDDSRCNGCSHATICLPDEQVHNGGELKRRISVADPHGEILHAVTPGARLSMRDRQIRITRQGEQLAAVPLERVQGLVLHGNVDVSGALIREILWRRLTIVWCSGRGRVVGWATGAAAPNGQARMHQQALSEVGCLPVARAIVRAKLINQATLLRRNAAAATAPQEIRELSRVAMGVESLPELFAVEGRAAKAYFSEFPLILKSDSAQDFLDEWPGRHGRGAIDPLNAALNYAYGMLLADCVRAIAACGLDPHGGFLHSPSRNKPALALDLMEEFRAPVADSAVITCINNQTLTADMFSHTLGDVRLTRAGIAALTSAYERRVTTDIKHPTFGYPATWRRTMEIQARLLLGFIDGTRSEYIGMTVR